MGGDGIATDARESASALRWWLEMGVDAPVQETARNRFEPVPAPQSAQPQPDSTGELPQSLDEFRDWLAGPDAPLASSASKPVIAQGSEGAELMIIAEPPSHDELASNHPVGGAPLDLLERMLEAIGMTGKAYLANLACFHSPGTRLTPRQIEECAAAARQHVALVRPKHLLLLGDLPARALLGKRLVEAREHVHKVEGVRTVATFHPRLLLKRPSNKALAWADLLLLTEEDQ
ncbi:MAG TPA: uracil-DNA glycosylase [Sphingomicrobium sp.]|nr:uracil-DNA glycosylase [Sphingomicrobium sp.]